MTTLKVKSLSTFFNVAVDKVYWTLDEGSHQQCYEPPVSIKHVHKRLASIKLCNRFLFLTLFKPALQPSLAHDGPAAHNQNKSAASSDYGSVPNIGTTRQASKHPAAGSGEFSFLWSFDPVIATVTCALREIILRE